jgi:3-dehydroquinate synthase
VTVVQRISVPFEYPVLFTEGAFARESSALVEVLTAREPRRRHRVLAVLDANLVEAWPSLVEDVQRYASTHAARLELVGPPLVIGGGEAGKNDPAVLTHLYDHLNANGMDRHSFAVLVGGGALLDVAGYAAATVHRGIRVVRLPTTVLSQADSGVGVKNGINRYGKKNFLGTFAPPFAVINDARFLRTLSRRDTAAGFSEAVKVALLRDASFFDALEAMAESLASGAADAVATLIRRSAELHLAHIAGSGDPFEWGAARPLDFGHWAAHKLESLTDHRLRHGEAVAVGLALDTLYAVRAGLCDEPTLERVLALLGALGLPRWDEAAADPRLLDGLDEFREHLGGELTITMIRRPGAALDVGDVDRDLMRRAIDELSRRAR